MTDQGGHLLVTAEDPAGPWSDPVRIPDALGIDPDLAWDDDGTLLPHLGRVRPGRRRRHLPGRARSGHRRITDRAAADSGREPAASIPEGPHLYRIGDYWYLLIAEGGTERGHAVTIARGPSPSGPFESSPGQPADHRPGHRRAGAEHRARRPGAAAGRQLGHGVPRSAAPRDQPEMARPRSGDVRGRDCLAGRLAHDSVRRSNLFRQRRISSGWAVLCPVLGESWAISGRRLPAPRRAVGGLVQRPVTRRRTIFLSSGGARSSCTPG